MELVVDVGNTETVVGLMEGRSLSAHWRISTGVPRTTDEYRHLLGSLLREAEVTPSSIAWGAIGSVVPDTTDVLRATLGAIVRGAVHVIDPDSPLPIRLDVEEPRTVGADRIVNTLAACEMYGRDTIAVDLGTATTYDLITDQHVF